MTLLYYITVVLSYYARVTVAQWSNSYDTRLPCWRSPVQVGLVISGAPPVHPVVLGSCLAGSQRRPGRVSQSVSTFV